MSARSLLEQAARTRLRLPPRELSPSVYVARGLVVRALRRAGLDHVLWREPCTFGIVGVPAGSVDAVTSAVRDILKAPLTANLGFDVTVHDRTERRSTRKVDIGTIVLDAAKGGDRACVLFSGHDAVSEAFLASAEGVVDLDPLDARILRGAFMRTVGKSPDGDGLDLVASLPLDLLDSVIVAGRSLERSLRVARKLLAAVASAEGKVDDDVEPTRDTADPGPRLEDLSGLGTAAEWGHDLARDLADYRKGSLSWADVDKGVLVAGPPGVGKTMFAQALGRSCGVPVHLHSCAQWQAAGHLGDLLKAMTKAFDKARRESPCIMFLDELDAFGSRDDPGDRYAAYTRQVIDGLLEQLDGAKGREGVIVVGATNRVELIDGAILRPGRMDRVITMTLPDRAARVGILRHHLRGTLETADLRPVSDRLEGASGADIELLVRDARRRARRRREPMRLADLETGLPPFVELSPELLWRVCVHEAGHLVAGSRLASVSECLPISSKIHREGHLAGTGETIFERRRGAEVTKATLMAEIVVLLAGTAAEEVLIGSRSVGAGGSGTSDLVLATDIARRIETVYGLGATLSTSREDTLTSGLKATLDTRSTISVEATLRACLDEATALMSRERSHLVATARLLEASGAATAPAHGAAAGRDGTHSGAERESLPHSAPATAELSPARPPAGPPSRQHDDADGARPSHRRRVAP